MQHTVLFVLGLKGTMSEAELHMMRQRLDAGRLSKVQHGEYIQHLPTGLVRTPDGRVEFDPDEQIRRVMALVFSTFTEQGSCMKTLHVLKRAHILLPRHQTSGLRKGELLWKEPTESMLVDILHNPAYAGAFVYGRRPTDPLRRRVGHRGSGTVRKPMQEWVTIQHGSTRPTSVGSSTSRTRRAWPTIPSWPRPGRQSSENRAVPRGRERPSCKG